MLNKQAQRGQTAKAQTRGSRVASRMRVVRCSAEASRRDLLAAGARS
jgi:hypothetical protein